jgi:hypothetical protein
MTNFKAGEWYQTRDGRQAYIYDPELHKDDDLKKIAGKVVDKNGKHVLVSWYPNGRLLPAGETDIDLVLGESLWVNVYSDFVSSSYPNRKDADKGSSKERNRVGVLKITVIDERIYTEVETCEPHTK